MEANDTYKKEAYQKGIYILLMLAVLTIGEFWLAYIGAPWWSVLILIAAFKAFLVVRDYMHIGRIFESEEQS
ncbi:MAG: cytochrome C oxidase subunit IV family protein [Anaerolineales bacterium]|nr:cytochrome C oxidase subunit IV family protein [Anaerolineales bacterium]